MPEVSQFEKCRNLFAEAISDLTDDEILFVTDFPDETLVDYALENLLDSERIKLEKLLAENKALMAMANLVKVIVDENDLKTYRDYKIRMEL